MKKKVFAIMLTAALVAAQSVSVFAASVGSIHGGTTSTPATNSGAGANTTSTAKETPTTTADGQSLAANGAGSKTENVKAEFAVNDAATAGLPAQAVAAINSINTGSDLATAIGNADLAGFAALTKTAAVVLTDTTTNTVTNKVSTVSLYIPNLISSLQNVKVLCYDNVTGQWKVIEPTAIDFATKTISFEMTGSGTVTIIHK